MELTAETIKVHVLDNEKLTKVLSEKIQKEHPSNKTYSIRIPFAIITEPKIGFITNECVGWDEQPFIIPVHGEEKSDDGKTTTFDMFPEYEFPFYLGDLEPFMGETMTLKEFMGGRFRYNGRIRANEQAWINHLSRPIGYKVS
jgi:hypothetical protein